MIDDDLIRRGDALALMRHDPFLIGVREDWAGMAPDEDGDWVSFHAIAALPASDPFADPRVKALVKAVEKLREIAGDDFADVDGIRASCRTTLAEIEGDKG